MEFKDNIINGYGIFYSKLGYKYEGNFGNSLLIRTQVIIYKIILFLNYLYSIIMRNKNTLFLIIILMLGILIN